MDTPSSTQQASDRTGSRLWHLGLLSALLLLAYLSYVGAFTRILDIIINGHIEQVARAYIKTTQHETTRIFEVLSAIKAALALLQSSTGGISFVVDVQVQLGQIMNVAAELINRAWLVTLGSLAAVEGLGLLLYLSRLTMAPILTLFFVSLGIAHGLQSRAPRPALAIAHMARLALLAALVVHFAIPLAIYGTAALGNFFFHGQKAEIRQGFEDVHAKTPTHELGIGLHEEVERLIKKFKDSQGHMHGRTHAIARLTGKHMLLSVAEHLVVPLVFLFLLWTVFRQILEKLWTDKNLLYRV